MKTTLGERIHTARKYAGLTQAQLASRIGVSKDTITKAENGRKTKSVIRIALACGVNPTWLETGKGTMSLSGNFTNNNFQHPASRLSYVCPQIPVICWCNIPNFCHSRRLFSVDEISTWIPVLSATSNQIFGLPIIDDMMSPEFCSGEYIVVDPTIIIARHQNFVVTQIGDIIVCRQFLELNHGCFLKDLRIGSTFIQVQESNFHIFGTVVSKYKAYDA